MRTRINILRLSAGLAAIVVCVAGCGDKIGGRDSGVALEWRDGQWVQRSQHARGTAEASLANISRLFEGGSYFRAVSAAKSHVKKYRGDPTSEEAYHLAGQSELARKRYYQAYEFFEHQLDQYPGGQFFERGLNGQLECAEAFLAGKRRILMGMFRVKAEEEGIMILEGVAEHAPGTRMAEQVMLRVADYQFSRGKYAEAADAYDRFMALFPKSIHSAHALHRAAESSHRTYRGPQYDDTPLLEAKHRYESLAEQFPEKAARINVDLILEDIRSARAAKLYYSAEFYERTRHPEAAVYYYRQVIELYPGTDSAGRSRIALARLSGAEAAALEAARFRPRQPAPVRQPAPTRRASPGRDIGPVGAQPD